MDWLIGGVFAVVLTGLFFWFCWSVENDPVRKEIEQFYKDWDRLTKKDGK